MWIGDMYIPDCQRRPLIDLDDDEPPSWWVMGIVYVWFLYIYLVLMFGQFLSI